MISNVFFIFLCFSWEMVISSTFRQVLEASVIRGRVRRPGGGTLSVGNWASPKLQGPSVFCLYHLHESACRAPCSACVTARGMYALVRSVPESRMDQPGRTRSGLCAMRVQFSSVAASHVQAVFTPWFTSVPSEPLRVQSRPAWYLPVVSPVQPVISLCSVRGEFGSACG